ncbi:hypothetical protein Taro_024652, partial [Colocasia esculenta]|nr:hypothetical protein [Colocasia esculenta]
MEKPLSSTLGCGAATPFGEPKAPRVPNPPPISEGGEEEDRRSGTSGWVGDRRYPHLRLGVQKDRRWGYLRLEGVSEVPVEP